MGLLLDERLVDTLLTPQDAMASVERAFLLLAEGSAVNEPRRRTRADGTTLNVMWALAPTLDAVAVKTYPVVRSDVSQAAVIAILLFSCSTGRFLGMVQGDLLGQRRTAAASALATRLAARPDSASLAVFGTGYQAAAQVRAVAAVLPALREVHVVGRTAHRRDAFLAALSADLPGLRVTGAGPEQAVRAADVVITATGSTEPVFDGDWLQPGTHVNAIGSNQPNSRELDGTALSRAACLMVDSREVAATEGGDLLANGVDVARATEFADVVAGTVRARRQASDITIFESHGLALQDLVCGLHVLRAAEAHGLGEQTVSLDPAQEPVPVTPQPVGAVGADGGAT